MTSATAKHHGATARKSDEEQTRQYLMSRTLRTRPSELYTARLCLRFSSEGNENLMMRARAGPCPDATSC